MQASGFFGPSGNVQLHLPGMHDLDKRFGGLLVREKGVDLADVAQPDHGIATEFGMVGGQKDFAGVVDDGPGGAHLPVVESRNRPGTAG